MDDVILRPIEEADLDDLCRYLTEPAAGGEFEWTGFMDPKAWRRRWDEDGWLGTDDGRLAVECSGSFAGDVNYTDRGEGVGKGAIYELGITLLPEHRGHGVGTAAQLLLVQYLFETTPAHRLQALTEVENLAEPQARSTLGFAASHTSERRAGSPLSSVMSAGQQADPTKRR